MGATWTTVFLSPFPFLQYTHTHTHSTHKTSSFYSVIFKSRLSSRSKQLCLNFLVFHLPSNYDKKNHGWQTEELKNEWVRVQYLIIFYTFLCIDVMLLEKYTNAQISNIQHLHRSKNNNYAKIHRNQWRFVEAARTNFHCSFKITHRSRRRHLYCQCQWLRWSHQCCCSFTFYRATFVLCASFHWHKHTSIYTNEAKQQNGIVFLSSTVEFSFNADNNSIISYCVWHIGFVSLIIMYCIYTEMIITLSMVSLCHACVWHEMIFTKWKKNITEKQQQQQNTHTYTRP